jgi:hypothetical protein
MTKHTQKEQVIAVLVDLSTGNHRDHAAKFVAHRSYDRLLCDHVYARASLKKRLYKKTGALSNVYYCYFLFFSFFFPFFFFPIILHSFICD